MFRVSRRVDYGLRLLIALASDSAEGPQSTASLAEKLDIPLAFLHQIGRSLIQAGILKASPGPGGGLRLNRSPEFGHSAPGPGSSGRTDPLERRRGR